MLRRKIWTPIFSFLRRDFRSISILSLSSLQHLQSSTISFSSSLPSIEQYRVFRSYEYNFLANFENNSVKGFCSKSSGAVDVSCWNCKVVAGRRPFLFCESCRSIQPVEQSVDYFQIFGLEKKYEIKGDNLEGKYKDWQKKLHPDLVHSKSEREREYAAEQSARVIDAYRTLTKPLSRAIYILKLEGVDVDEEQTVSEPDLLSEKIQELFITIRGRKMVSSANCMCESSPRVCKSDQIFSPSKQPFSSSCTALPHQYLIFQLIMEIREAVEEAADSQALKHIQSQVEKKLKHWSKCFANAFESQKFVEASTCIQRMTYYERINEEIVKKL